MTEVRIDAWQIYNDASPMYLSLSEATCITLRYFLKHYHIHQKGFFFTILQNIA